MSDLGEIWQVEVDGQVYEADLATLKQWIVEGALQPQDRVRRGKLNWLEAQRVPALRPVFAGQEVPDTSASSGGYAAPATSSAMPYAEPGTDASSHAGYGAAGAGAPYDDASYGDDGSYGSGPATFGAAPAAAREPFYHQHGSATCVNHPEIEPNNVCTSCGAAFCRPCTKLVNHVPICTLCGSLCRPFEEVSAKQSAQLSLGAGFGLADFARALAYPFNDKVSLLLACVFFGFIDMLPHIYATLFSYGLLFGSMSYIINRVAMGKLEGGILPDFSENIFDTLFGGARLALAVAIITYGPMLLLLFVFMGTIGFSSLEGAVASLGIPILVGGLWALLYYPMALLVAGFTRSFFAVINPVVGIDTIMRMGLTYVKAYFMCFAVYIPLFIFQTVVQQVMDTTAETAPALLIAGTFLFGNIAIGSAKFLAAAIVSCILGLALWKEGDKLGLR